MLGSYYYGYVVTQIAGAYLASKIGFKLTWGIASVGSSILTLLTPTVARHGGFSALFVRGRCFVIFSFFLRTKINCVQVKAAALKLGVATFFRVAEVYQSTSLPVYQSTILP